MEIYLTLNKILAIASLVGIGVLIKLIVVTATHKYWTRFALYRWFLQKRIWLIVAFVLALFAIAGTLIYSEALHFPPCRLCWFQRIFMYPILILLGHGMVRRETVMVPYVRILALGGSLVALYHYAVQMLPGVAASCGAESVSCAERLVFEFGFVTMPFMSLVIFLLIFVSLGFRRKAKALS